MTSITRKPSTARLDPLPEFDANVRSDCPAWCLEEHPSPTGGDEHIGEIHGVELAAHSVTVPNPNGIWGTYPLEILLTIETNDGKSPHIALIGHDDETAGNLTADEADQLAEVLHTLAAALRGTHP
ncbi:MAG: DUF6907 domain-containing protein [Actinoallomurus sp.]